MEIRERLLLVRKSKKLNQTDFAKAIGVTGSAICNYENGTRPIGNQVIRAVCREFQINEEWLRSGIGEMDSPEPSGVVGELVEAYKLNNFEAAFLESYLKLSQEDRQGFCRYVVGVFGDVFAKLSAEDLDALSPCIQSSDVDVVSLLQKSPADMTEAEVEALEAEFHREILQEKEAAAGSSVSSDSAGSQSEKRKKA